MTKPPRIPDNFLDEVETALRETRAQLDCDRERLRALDELHSIARGVARQLGRPISVFDGSRIVTLDFPSHTVYTLDAADGSDLRAVHPGGFQFVPGWQPRGTGATGEDDG